MVLSQQPKRIGKWGDWLNVQVDGDEKPSSLNLKNVVTWKKLPTPEKVVLLSSAENMSQEVLNAKFKEIGNLMENNVFDVVPDVQDSAVFPPNGSLRRKFEMIKSLLKHDLSQEDSRKNLRILVLILLPAAAFP